MHVLRVVGVIVCWVAPRWAGAQVAGDDHEPVADPSQLEPAAPPFGTAGEVAISGASGLGAGYTTYDGSQASSLSLSFSPAVDVFILRNVSLGFSGGVSYGDERGYGADYSLVETTSTSIWGALRVGVNVPISSSLSFWPRALVGLQWEQETQQAVDGGTISVANPLGAPTTTREGPWLELVLPVTVHVAPHVFVGFGPSIFQDLTAAKGARDAGGERTTLGAALDVGGWFGGRPDDVAGDSPEVVPVRRFGSRRDVIITNAIVLQGGWTTYAGSKASSKNIAIIPGVDYFVDERFSVGIALSGSYSGGAGTDPSTGDPVIYSTHAFGGAPRIGAVVPMGKHTSFWPQAAIGLGKSSYDESEGTTSNDETEWYVSISLDAPVLVHISSHFFVGFGPWVSQDLYHAITYPDSPTSSQNRATSVGAGLVVGGVL